MRVGSSSVPWLKLPTAIGRASNVFRVQRHGSFPVESGYIVPCCMSVQQQLAGVLASIHKQKALMITNVVCPDMFRPLDMLLLLLLLN